MRSSLDRLFDYWNELGIWARYGLVAVAAIAVLTGLLQLAQVL